jgi:hypothetical protein
MNRYEFLTALHEAYKPRSYLEIGVNEGRSLAQSTTRTIGVDPDFQINVELACDLKLVKMTSDDFFARPDATSWFPEDVVDFTFIDGRHIFEFALRDFINAEKLSAPASVIVLDDIFPRSASEAARDRHTLYWAGDVYKIMVVLEENRPDLTVVPTDTEPTGVAVVLGLDPSSTVLPDNYDTIVEQYGAGNSQPVPEKVLRRHDAANPRQVVKSPVWGQLAAARATGAPVAFVERLRRLRGTAQFELVPPSNEPWPPKDAVKARRAR